ncbi:MAG TPA: hypothetical protein VIZ58_09345 [Thermoanaerobaculia bacterium]
MSVLYLQFEASDRAGRAARLGKSGAHIVISEPRWPQFFELAKKEKPYAIAIDMSAAPSHCLETADYISKAKETRDTPLFLLRVPEDRLEAVKKRLPNAPIVTEQELAHTLIEEERKAQQRAREKKEAAAAARKTARAKKLGLDGPPAPGKTGRPPAKAAAAAPEKKKAPAPAPKKKAAAPAKKKSAARPAKKK